MGRPILCEKCASLIDTSNDEFCMVVPHGMLYHNANKIPMCRECRIEEGYDIVGSYNVITRKVEQPQLPQIEYKPEEKIVYEEGETVNEKKLVGAIEEQQICVA